MSEYDVIIIGAGSVGVPSAMSLAEAGKRVLCVDRNAAPGQGDNKHAIGGIRSTHSDVAKITLCNRSLEIFSTWKEKFGDDIEWIRGGYCFPVYTENDEKALKSLLPIQKRYGLEIDFHPPERIKELIPGIMEEGLRGGTFSPNDGNASPLLSVLAFEKRAKSLGATFHYCENVLRVNRNPEGAVTGITTSRGTYNAPVVIDCAGAYTVPLMQASGIIGPLVTPDEHEAGITEPVERFFDAMVVDIRPVAGSKNYYYYPNAHGQIVFCITPAPAILGTDTQETSVFLPQVAARMVQLQPRLRNLKVRRTWRGLYPMTADGSPMVGWNRDVPGLLHVAGMCGQGFMLGPGLGELVTRMVNHAETSIDREVLEVFNPYRGARAMELLK